MALPQDGQAANGLTKVTKVPAGKELIFIDPTTNEGGIITLENLTEQILQGLTSQTFTLAAGTKTIPAVLDEICYPFLSEGTVVSDEDLNTVTTSGLQPKIYGRNCTNSPGFGCFILNIKEKTTNVIYQIAFGYRTQNLAVRSGDGSSGTWASWVKIYEAK